MTCVIGSIMVSRGLTGFYAKYRENIVVVVASWYRAVLMIFMGNTMKNADNLGSL